uniref:FHA domain-containing protein n=1 Tax=Chromera velia CCMP2878 TaxID=1169474 RepID=A0A0G4F188_9ALVE|eukprot:Cvel_2614.t1-p1 / transcript=Cvel_2614.t1 / gene=Cvel_2614 / organism=Chromera_velia_CCMP2878 / gene_product=E3 ubiquitin-protein ligase MARCH8, putative / transcript_product=E3 ubiquitin-protein ligase MARCH8, putative / location=Cvel_scaffold103:102285-106399(-) / protein_length=584 / sequence_SO=supercontig / SO=protein_coding / is_pseudo=false
MSKSNLGPKAPPPVLKVGTTTWARDSHELFDYEARHVTQKTFFVRHAVKCFRQSQEIHLVPEGGANMQNSDYLVRLTHNRDGKYLLCPAERMGAVSPKKLWLIVRELANQQHKLQEGDVIKLGRFKLRVKQMQVDPPATGAPVVLKLDDTEPTEYKAPENADKLQCRICLLEGTSDEDPLVTPCHCKGSIEYVHIGCLRHWVNGKLNLQADQPNGCFFYKQTLCELCKAPFPQAVVYNGTHHSVVSLPPTPAPFIILENLAGQPAQRGQHVISMSDRKMLKLGRGHESDVRIADVSISRYHATIRFNEESKTFFLEDHNSKFGTLVNIRKPQLVDGEAPLSVQVGRTVLALSIAKNPPPIGPEGVLVQEADATMEDAAGSPNAAGESSPGGGAGAGDPNAGLDLEAQAGGEGGGAGDNGDAPMPAAVQAEAPQQAAPAGIPMPVEPAGVPLRAAMRPMNIPLPLAHGGAPGTAAVPVPPPGTQAPPAWGGEVPGWQVPMDGARGARDPPPMAGMNAVGPNVPMGPVGVPLQGTPTAVGPPHRSDSAGTNITAAVGGQQQGQQQQHHGSGGGIGSFMAGLFRGSQ